jgi:hypothetical protein
MKKYLTLMIVLFIWSCSFDWGGAYEWQHVRANGEKENLLFEATASPLAPGFPFEIEIRITLEALDVDIGIVEIRLSKLVRTVYIRIVDPNEAIAVEIHEISKILQNKIDVNSDNMWMDVKVDPFPDTEPIGVIRLEEEPNFKTLFCLLLLPDGTQALGGFEGLSIEPEDLATLGAVGGAPPMTTALFSLRNYYGGEGLLRAHIGDAQLELPIVAVSSSK